MKTNECSREVCVPNINSKERKSRITIKDGERRRKVTVGYIQRQ